MLLFICWFQTAHELEILEGWEEKLLLQYFQLDKNQKSIGNLMVSSTMHWPRKFGEAANKHPDVWINSWTEKEKIFGGLFILNTENKTLFSDINKLFKEHGTYKARN